MDALALKNLPSLGAPPNSKNIMTPTAFMTDEAWAELVPGLAKGIRLMPVRFFECRVSFSLTVI